jgi:hypothetical protein
MLAALRPDWKQPAHFAVERSWNVLLTNYFLVPLTTVLTGFLLARFFKKGLPRFYSLITGGR